MKVNSVHVFVLLVCTLPLLACDASTEFPDPKTLPYTLEQALDLGTGYVFFADIDDDRADEVVRWYSVSSSEDQNGYIFLQEQDGRTIGEAHFTGKLIRTDHLEIHDYDKDGSLEILVPFIRNDSLFVSFVDAKGNKLFHFFLINGKPRKEDSGVIPWDPIVQRFYITDVNRDGQDELITIIRTNLAGLPRGVLVHALSSGQPLGNQIIGSQPGPNFLDDFNGDGSLEVVVGTSAPDNGASAGGFDDQHTYLIAFDLNPAPEILSSEEKGDVWSDLSVFYKDFDGDGDQELLTFTWSDAFQTDGTLLELIEPGTWEAVYQKPLDELLQGPVLIDIDLDARPEILMIRKPGSIWVIDNTFEIIAKQQIAAQLDGLHVVPDVDGDGIEEIIANTRDGGLWLDANLDVKAAFPRGALDRLLRRGAGTQPYLLAHQERKTIALRMVKNHWYLVHRYGPWALRVGFVGMWLMIGILIVMLNRERRRARQLSAKKERELAEAQRLITKLERDKQRLAYLLRDSAESAREDPKEDFVTRVYEVIGEHYGDEHFKVTALAETIGCSTKTLQRVLKDKLGVAPHEAIVKFRIDRAKELMDKVDGTARVAEIAYATGFKNRSHFSTCFKKHVGISPSAYSKNSAPSSLKAS